MVLSIQLDCLISSKYDVGRFPMVIFSFTLGKHHSKKKDEKLHWWARSGQPATGLNFLWNDMSVRKTLTY